MSRAKVLLDELLQLGGGERAGAAQVLAEMCREDPALLSAALALCAGDPLVAIATRIAGPWTSTPAGHWVRPDPFRVQPVGTVTPLVMGRFSAMINRIPSHCGNHNTLEEAQAAVDKALRGSWVLL